MNPWVVFVPFLLQIAVALVIGLSWVLFIRNIIRNSRQKNQHSSIRRMSSSSSNSATRSQKNWDRRSVIENYAKKDSRTSQGQQRRNSGKRQTRTVSSQSKSESIFNRFMKQSPQELYKLLEKRLPSQYQAELERIFNSPQWKREIWRFLKREDVWPWIQSILQSEQTRSQEKETISSPSFAEVREADKGKNNPEGIAHIMEQEAASLEEEYSSLVSSYDTISDNLDRETSLSSLEQKASQLDSRRRTAERTNRKKTALHQKWLKDAILAKEILERPDF